MKESLNELGNCGCSLKVSRIMDAFRIAKREDCALTIVLDQLVYGKTNCLIKFSKEEIKQSQYSFTDDTLTVTVGEHKYPFPWWDIVKIHVIF